MDGNPVSSHPVAGGLGGSIGSVLGVVQRFGWLLLIFGGIIYYFYRQQTEKRKHDAIFDPERVAKLEEERRKKLIENADKWKASPEQRQHEKENDEREKKLMRKYGAKPNKEDGAAPREAKHFDGGGPNSGRGGAKLFGIQNRYPGKGGGCGPTGG